MTNLLENTANGMERVVKDEVKVIIESGSEIHHIKDLEFCLK